MYYAYYLQRYDGDGDLCAVVESGDSISDELADAIREKLEKTLNESGEKWFRRESSECNFPDVWDLTKELIEWETFMHHGEQLIEEVFRLNRPTHYEKH